MAFDANRLFDSRSGSVRYQSRSLLDKILAYRTISGGRSITVDYEYLAGKESPETAALRASAIVDYLSIKSGLSPGWFTINPPKPVQPRSATSGGYQPPAPRPTSSIINIRIERAAR